MIKANELRIGNLVLNDDNDILEVEIISTSEISSKDGWDLDEKSLTPIPLTEEWLVKLGFSYLNIGEQYTVLCEGRERIFIQQNKDSDDKGYDLAWHEEHLKTVHYVHELQNIYFALSDIELTIKS